MKKILIIVAVVLVVAGIVTLTIVRAQAGYTKVMTAKVVREKLVSTVSGTGQIKPRTYVNVGAEALGRITHLYVKEGDHVHTGEILATIENVQQAANVNGQKDAIAAAKTDILADIANVKTQQATVEHARADLVQKSLDYKRAKALYAAQVMSKQDFDAKKAAYDTDLATLAQAQAAVAQANAEVASARAHMNTQQANLKANVDLYDKTIAIAPFNGIVTNLPVREGETVVPGIQDTNGSVLMTLADTSVMTAEVKVDETDIVNVALGQKAEVTVDALPGKVFIGHVTEVGDQALLRSTGLATSQTTSGQEEAKDFKVVITLDHPSDDLKPGLSTTAKIITATVPNAVVIPIQSLVLRNPHPQKASAIPTTASFSTNIAAADPGQNPNEVQGVFIVRNEKGKLRAHFVPVKTGVTGVTDIQALSGVEPGDEIITGTFQTLRDLKEGALLKRDNTPIAAPSESASS
ncbi:MAG TPA: efflux RND transporter periplasmic adaptor subunit [Acidobacteriaceae bacterium]|nr:efflux RND transporter periplasmic adaptor subunit [Acidobacteriaceae bacterium]